MKTLYKQINVAVESGRTSTHYEVFEHNGRKFLVIVRAGSGDCLGFNSDCCLKVMTSDGDWSGVVDNRLIGVKFEKDNIYYVRDKVELKKSLLNEPVKAFKDYVQKIY